MINEAEVYNTFRSSLDPLQNFKMIFFLFFLLFFSVSHNYIKSYFNLTQTEKKLI